MRLLSFLLLAHVACTPAPGAKDDPRTQDDPPACSAPFVGALTPAGVEGEPGYDAALAARDLDALPTTLSLAGESALVLETVAYMLDAPQAETVDKPTALASGDLGRAVVAAFVGSEPPAIDFAFLRRGLQRFYACERGYPATLAGFKADIYDFTTDPPDQTVDSAVKNLRRRITRSGVAGVFVAETLRADDSVRETEIILTDRRDTLTLDFLEYDDEGRLRSASEFAGAGGAESVGAVPYACIACHRTNNVVPGP